MVAWSHFFLASVLFFCRIFKIVFSPSDGAPKIDSRLETRLISSHLTCASRSSLFMRWSYVGSDVSSPYVSAGFLPLLFWVEAFFTKLEGLIGTSPPPTCKMCA